MASDSTLTTTTSTGAQSASSPDLQAPNNANSVSGGTPSSIQPVVSGSQLDSTNGGVPLAQTSLASSSVPITSASTATTLPPPATHHINGGLLSVSVLLFVVAVGLYWFTGRADKNTTF